MDFEDPLQFWEILSAAMNENPPPAEQVKGLLPMFEPLGLQLGKQWDLLPALITNFVPSSLASG
jgi:DNA sulfur modification protein DndE